MTINRLPLWTLVAGAALSLRVAACGGDCPPFQRDDVYPLDMRPDGGGSSNPAPDAAVPDGGGATLDAGVRVNCGALAAGCTPGQACPPACDCVLARQRMVTAPGTVVDQCTLVAGGGVPSVEIRAHVRVGCE